MPIFREFAPAKLNLYLHVTGRKPDGYHELDSLVAFATIGDEVALRQAQAFRFEITGKQAGALAHEDSGSNLVVKVARALADATGKNLDVHMALVKNLPVASGIGGGSSDAAAALRLLARYWNIPQDDPRLMQIAVSHGQDIGVCLRIENKYMTANGILPAQQMPRADIVLINPGKGLSTPAVFKEYKESGAAFSPLSRLGKTPETLAELVAALKMRNNNLYAPACRLMPEIADIITALDTSQNCLFARMSGSGATCFGLYPDEVSAKSAAAQIRAARPRWWVEAGVINEK